MKTVTKDDVDRDFQRLTEEANSKDGRDAAWRLRNTAAQVPALQEQVEAARAALDEDGAQSKEGATLAHRIAALAEDRDGEKARAERAEGQAAALQARVAELERQQAVTAKGLKNAMEHAEVAVQAKLDAESERDALHARVSELEGKQTTMRGELQKMQGIVNAAVEQREAAEAERDALHAQVEKARALCLDVYGDLVQAKTGDLPSTVGQKIATALSTPPAEAETPERAQKRSCNLHADCDTEPGPCCNSSDCPDHQ